MKTNLGDLARGLIIFSAIILSCLFYFGSISGPSGIILVVLAVVFAITSFVAFVRYTCS